MTRRPHSSTLFPYTTLFRSEIDSGISRRYNDNTPPVSASGTPLKIISASFTEAKAMTRIPSITNKVRDRKSTRLNSSHVAISYAVFCLKKKRENHRQQDQRT